MRAQFRALEGVLLPATEGGDSGPLLTGFYNLYWASLLALPRFNRAGIYTAKHFEQ